MTSNNNSAKTNIDFSKYADNQIATHIEAAINFPAAVSFNMIVLPIIFTVAAFICALLLTWYFSVVMGILLGLAAFTTVPIMAYAFGLSATISQLVDDGEALFESALGLIENIAADLPSLHAVDYKLTPSQFFKAAAQAVIIPIMAQKIAAKVPLFGGALASRSRRMLETMIGSVDIPALAATPDNNAAFAANLNDFAAKARQSISKITNNSRAYLVSPSRRTAWGLLILHIIIFAFMAIPHFL
jgi:hypothetical protein